MKKFGYAVIALIAIVGILGLIAPRDYVVEREIVINKPREAVFAFARMLQNNKKWDPWSKKDPNIKMDFRGTDGQVGAVSSWSGNSEVGVGEEEIKSIAENERIDFELRFKEPMQDTGAAYYVFETVGDNQTKMKWGISGRSQFPINIVCMLMNMKATLAKEFDTGLASFKTAVESEPTEAAPPAASEPETPAGQ